MIPFITALLWFVPVDDYRFIVAGNSCSRYNIETGYMTICDSEGYERVRFPTGFPVHQVR